MNTVSNYVFPEFNVYLVMDIDTGRLMGPN